MWVGYGVNARNVGVDCGFSLSRTCQGLAQVDSVILFVFEEAESSVPLPFYRMRSKLLASNIETRLAPS